MMILKLLCRLAILISNRNVMFFGLFVSDYLFGMLILSDNIFIIYSILLFFLYPFIFYLMEISIFSEFEEHRKFFKKFLEQLKNQE